MTDRGVDLLFLRKTSKIKIASASIRYMIRQVAPASLIRNSCHRAPTEGIGLEWACRAFHPVAICGASVPLPTLLSERTAESLFRLPTRRAAYPPKPRIQLYVTSDMPSRLSILKSPAP